MTSTRGPRVPRGGHPKKRRSDRLVFLLAVVVAVPAVGWAALRFADRDGSSSALPADDPGVAHVHGLGINPADGSLYVATHHGTFRIGKDKTAERVGASFQDTMGFTVAGPDRFLGSGHPDMQGFRQGQPSRLGLIESSDAGKTWRTLSLSGEADFHGLAAAHGQVYGWDSGTGRFMTSADRRTWETRSTQPLAAFAVDPKDPDHIVGAAPDGPVDSTDGGRTWTVEPGPLLVVLSWDVTAGLVGAGTDGALHRSDDGGVSWQASGRLPGEPQALLATGDAFYVAAADREGITGIYRSTDGGRTWRLFYRDRA